MRHLIHSLLLVVILVCGGTSGDAGESTTTPAVHSPDRHAGFLAEIAARKGDIDLVFVGDSITDGWRKVGKKIWDSTFAPLKALNLGYQAKLFVVMIGTNNTKGRDSATAIANGVQAIINEIIAKQPQAKILLLGIFSRGPRTFGAVFDDAVKKMETIRAINADLSTRSFGKAVRYLDLSDKFLVEGKIPDDVMPDQLHPGIKGYQIWADAVLPVITELMGTK